jgi:hypothetical protein
VRAQQRYKKFNHFLYRKVLKNCRAGECWRASTFYTFGARMIRDRVCRHMLHTHTQHTHMRHSHTFQHAAFVLTCKNYQRRARGMICASEGIPCIYKWVVCACTLRDSIICKYARREFSPRSLCSRMYRSALHVSEVAKRAEIIGDRHLRMEIRLTGNYFQIFSLLFCSIRLSIFVLF